MSIEIKNVSKRYGDRSVVDNVSFSVSDNDITAFLGENGAGKSTTMKIITGFLAPDSGQILINGTDLHKNLKEVQHQIGYLPENNPLYPELYVKEYLEYVARIFRVKNVRTSVENVIERVGLQKESKKQIGQLSKGYKQRVGLAQAIIHEPGVLILDEPTTGLDPNQLYEVRQLLKDLSVTTTILYSTHSLQEVTELSHHIVTLHLGKIVDDTTYNDIPNLGTIEKQFRSQTKG